MITDAGNTLAKEIMAKAKEYEGLASMSAVDYARTDNADAKACFQKYTALENCCRTIHTLVCQGLHAVEQEMEKRVDELVKKRVEAATKVGRAA
jgi:hypothetical protein